MCLRIGNRSITPQFLVKGKQAHERFDTQNHEFIILPEPSEDTAKSKFSFWSQAVKDFQYKK